jgi:hypothetical protein
VRYMTNRQLLLLGQGRYLAQHGVLDSRCDGLGVVNLWDGTSKTYHVLSLAPSKLNIDAYWPQMKLAVFPLETTKSDPTLLYLLFGRPQVSAFAPVS